MNASIVIIVGLKILSLSDRREAGRDDGSDGKDHLTSLTLKTWSILCCSFQVQS